MSVYELYIYISAEDLPAIYKHKKKIAIAREVQGGESQPLVWVAFAPFEANFVGWGDNYGIYASWERKTNDESTGRETTVTKGSENSLVRAGMILPFVGGAFGTPTAAHDKGYGISNQDEAVAQFGLTQSANVGGEPLDSLPLNSVDIAPGDEVLFEPSSELWVSLSDGPQGSPLPLPMQGALIISPAKEKPSLDIHYDHATETFMEGPLPEEPEK